MGIGAPPGELNAATIQAPVVVTLRGGGWSAWMPEPVRSGA